ncbi:uncharacterized protein [Cardiocondyla obscurior]|uniref:uncharacterized protein n=1 Tax=Cardiocondyla obscurior TaxID=286306 RepID=UPI003965879B
MEKLLRDQLDLEGRMSRTIANLKKLGAKRINAALIKASIQSLNEKWKKFEEHHEKLCHEHWEELRTTLERGQRHEAAPKTVVQDPAQAPLPKVHIPAFLKRYEDWLEFRDLFQLLIIDNLTVSDVSRFHYLKSSLKGDAQQLLRQYQLTAENFAPA